MCECGCTSGNALYKLPGNQGSMMITMFEQAAWAKENYLNDMKPLISLPQWLRDFGTLRFSSIRQSGHTTGIFDLLDHVAKNHNYNVAKDVLIIVPTVDYQFMYREFARKRTPDISISENFLHNMIFYPDFSNGHVANRFRSKHQPKLIIVDDAKHFGFARENLLYETLTCYAQQNWNEMVIKKIDPPIIFFVH